MMKENTTESTAQRNDGSYLDRADLERFVRERAARLYMIGELGLAAQLLLELAS